MVRETSPGLDGVEVAEVEEGGRVDARDRGGDGGRVIEGQSGEDRCGGRDERW